jgi:hypothetical protein
MIACWMTDPVLRTMSGYTKLAKKLVERMEEDTTPKPVPFKAIDSRKPEASARHFRHNLTQMFPAGVRQATAGATAPVPAAMGILPTAAAASEVITRTRRVAGSESTEVTVAAVAAVEAAPPILLIPLAMIAAVRSSFSNLFVYILVQKKL